MGSRGSSPCGDSDSSLTMADAELNRSPHRSLQRVTAQHTNTEIKDSFRSENAEVRSKADRKRSPHSDSLSSWKPRLASDS
ncbi:hypothetical protein STEG23_014094 [Scotinomys teguina]